MTPSAAEIRQKLLASKDPNLVIVGQELSDAGLERLAELVRDRNKGEQK